MALREDLEAHRPAIPSPAETAKSARGPWPAVNAGGGMLTIGEGTPYLSLARVEDLKPESPADRKLIADARQLRDDTVKLNAASASVGTSCADIDAFERTAETVAAYTADQFHSFARSLRSKQTEERRAAINATMGKTYNLPDSNAPGGLRENIAPTKKLAAEIRCYDASVAKAEEEEVATWAMNLEKAIKDEEVCRATPSCLGDRVAARICPILTDRKEALAGIAQERRNPGGVVDLVALHDYGERAQIDAGNIASLKAEYSSIMHRGFSPASCAKFAE